MKPTSKELLEKISGYCCTLSTRYRYARAPHWSKKYSEGQLAGLEYIYKLCLYFLQEEKSIKDKFREQNSCLNDSEYNYYKSTYFFKIS